MEFRPEAVEEFKQIFAKYQSAIAAQSGCIQVELWQEKDASPVFFTHSHWESVADLNAYRNSETFGKVWPLTKALFAKKPEAWSFDKVL